MNSQDDRENEVQRRERELQAREQALRLRELETEIAQRLLYQTVKHREPETRLDRRDRQFATVGKFLALVIVVVVTIKLVTWLATVVIVGTVAWVAYKLFLERDRSKH